MTISDCLPLLSKITTYADEYIIGEMLIFDTGSQSVEPNNAVMCRVIIYNDGYICAWFDKESQAQVTGSAFTFVDAETLAGFTTHCEYPDQWNGCYLEITGSTDPDCPTGTIFTIRDTDEALSHIKVHKDYSSNLYHFNTGYTYDADIFMSNGNLVWWGVDTKGAASPDSMVNRLYRAIYEMWENLKTRSDTTSVSNAPTTYIRVHSYHNSIYYDETTDFNDSNANDVTLVYSSGVVDDAIYYGLDEMFNAMELNIGTAGVGNTIVWEYWDGSAWSSLSVTDNTSGFTVAGTNTVTFVPPSDWVMTDVSSYDRYWIRSRLSVASFTTSALLTQGWLKVPDSLVYTDTNLGMYSFEDTSALYCLLCGKSPSSYTYHFFYNTCLLGKTIYCHVINWAVYDLDPYIYVNDTEIADYSSVAYMPGYVTNNIESIDGLAGIQNVFKFPSSSTIYRKGKMAAVLITS